MIKWILLAFTGLLLLAGCTSTGFAGLAKESYAVSIDEELSESQASVEQLRQEVEDIKRLADKLSNLVDDIEEAKKDTEELKALAKLVEERLNTLPRQTLEKLVEALKIYLEKEQSY